MHSLLLSLALSFGADAADGWKVAEAAHLKNITQVTRDFVRAGEGYFSPDGKKAIFQAEEKDSSNPFYQIFVQDIPSGRPLRISPGMGRTTCSYFRPDGKRVIFASSHGDPDVKKQQEAEIKQREEDRKKGSPPRRYSWSFDPHMKIYETNPDGTGSKQLTTAPNCYNGGPFFSPDGTKVIFRSDRKEKDRLQLYVINADGTGEKAITANDKWVYWAPYWYKDGKHIIYTAADHTDPTARPNYDLFWMNIETGKTTRITHAPGQDVLPVFSPDYSKVMWTTSRDGRSPTQLYIADFTPPKE